MGDRFRRGRDYDQPGGGHQQEYGGGGYKRKREEHGGQEDGIKPLLASIIQLCDQQPVRVFRETTSADR